MPEKLVFVVPEKFNNVQAKHFFREFCGLSSRMITQLKREKDGILMNGKILRTIDFVKAGDEVIINLPDEEMQIVPIKGKLDIVYEDNYLLVVNKPPFMPVHPVKQHQSDTLANIVAYYCSEKQENFVFRALNRLDRDTSGLVLIAKDRFTANKLKFSVKKAYYALVHGKITKNGTIKAPIGLLEDSKMVRHVLEEGSPAITNYEVFLSNEEFSFLKLRLETGKTHQIRCHMTSLGHPLLGDDLYGGSRSQINRQALHCGEMEFIHPITEKLIKLSADIPDDMLNIINENED